MAETIEFDKTYFYSMFNAGITVSVNLFYADKEVEFDAKIDTGSTFCVFQRLHGELLGLEIEKGIPADISTATGSFRAYGHELTLTVLGIETVSTVYFAESDYFDRNVLGRIGWLDRVKLGLIEQEGKLFLSEYKNS
jgi:predicted aspartyl protease